MRQSAQSRKGHQPCIDCIVVFLVSSAKLADLLVLGRSKVLVLALRGVRGAAI